MIFSPVLRRNAFNPQAADLALQRFLQSQSQQWIA